MPTNTLTPAVVPAMELANSNRVWETLPTLHDDMENHPYFIEGPSHEVSLQELGTHIIPCFGDNTLTLSHIHFAETVKAAAAAIFGNHITTPEFRVSHKVEGRIPEARFKKASDLLDHERTVFFQRAVFIMQVVDMTTEINGKKVSLCIGGCRSYSSENLSYKATAQHFKVFCGFRVRACSNLMLTCDGVSGTILAMTEMDLFQKSLELFSSFKVEKELEMLESLRNIYISQRDFCKVIGRMRLYQALPTAQQKTIGKLLIGDSIVNGAVKEYATNPAYGVSEGDGSINMWDFLQIFTEATKSSYIDQYVDRMASCTELATGIMHVLRGESNEYSWFLN